MIKTKYITTEIYKPVAQKDTVGFGFGIASLPLFFVGIFGLLGLFFSIRTLKKTKNSKAETAKADRTYATIGLALSSVGLLFTLLFGFTYLKEEYVKVAAVTKKDKIEITFVQMEKYSFQRNEDGLSPDIYIYQVKINDPKDSAKLEDAIILKCKEERKYTDSYYYFADVEIPTLIKNKVWNEAIDFFEKTNAVAIIDIDRSGDDRSYRIKNKDGKLSKMIKL